VIGSLSSSSATPDGGARPCPQRICGGTCGTARRRGCARRTSAQQSGPVIAAHSRRSHTARTRGGSVHSSPPFSAPASPGADVVSPGADVARRPTRALPFAKSCAMSSASDPCRACSRSRRRRGRTGPDADVVHLGHRRVRVQGRGLSGSSRTRKCWCVVSACKGREDRSTGRNPPTGLKEKGNNEVKRRKESVRTDRRPAVLRGQLRLQSRERDRRGERTELQRTLSCQGPCCVAATPYRYGRKATLHGSSKNADASRGRSTAAHRLRRIRAVPGGDDEASWRVRVRGFGGLGFGLSA
jgi:hypothetical protein